MAFINPESRLAEKFWENGRVEECPILDFHGHMHEMAGGFMPGQEPERMLVTMKRAGVANLIFCSHLALFAADGGESFNVGPVKKFDGPLRAYMAVRSYDLNFERDIKIFEENKNVYAGFKFLSDYFHIPLESPLQEKYWEYANEKKLLCLCHTWAGSPYDGPENVRAVAAKYPGATILCGHSFHGDWETAVKIANEFPNIYLELTAVMDNRGALETFVRGAGSEKILFGTDLPWFSTFYYVGCILDADITDDDRRNIFYKNGDKLLKRFPWYKGLMIE